MISTTRSRRPLALSSLPVRRWNVDVEADRNRHVVAPSQEPHADDRGAYIWVDQFNLGADWKHDNALNPHDLLVPGAVVHECFLTEFVHRRMVFEILVHMIRVRHDKAPCSGSRETVEAQGIRGHCQAMAALRVAACAAFYKARIATAPA